VSNNPIGEERRITDDISMIGEIKIAAAGGVAIQTRDREAFGSGGALSR
jgi:hypothetical protein